MEKKVLFQARVPTYLNDKIKTVAKEKGVSKNSLVIFILEEYLKRERT